ncbi:hypothetical protein AXF42_Ash005969 [Apostasia shenzhenica]|uniref:Uncharacterized protein n=1 Tax=Apostasia shenzhenica TaxID=1088818 RepID=A0A2I0AZU6_9ASPA|nr:hypothetical protein AXF42_Ash005969 [Apostasia shenzhenica]
MEKDGGRRLEEEGCARRTAVVWERESENGKRETAGLRDHLSRPLRLLFLVLSPQLLRLVGSSYSNLSSSSPHAELLPSRCRRLAQISRRRHLTRNSRLVSVVASHRSLATVASSGTPA